SVLRGTGVRAQVDEAEGQGDDDQDVAQRGTLAEVELDEAHLVAAGGEGLGGVGGASAGQADDEVEDLDRVDHPEQQHHGDHGTQHRQGDVPEGLRSGGDVELAGLVEL